MMVVLMGADGSGKSTVARRIGEAMADVFPRTHYVHLRPGLGTRAARSSAPATNPHGSPARGRISSILKILYFVFDYTAGHFLKIRPMTAKSLVVFDRYYHDILVDPVRYRYGGPKWLVRLGARLVHRPDAFVLLDAPVEVLRARKQEVAPAETARQRQAYLELVRPMANGHVIDASGPMDRVVADVREAILDAAQDVGQAPISRTRS
jgi:thymidylate kinase